MALLLFSSLLQLATSLCFFGLAWSDLRARRHFAQRMGTRTPTDRTGLLRELGDSSLGRRSLSLDSETLTLLNRLGWRKARQRALFSAIQLGLPVLLVVLVIVVQLLMTRPPHPVWLAPVFALGIGYLIPKRVLAKAAANRQERLVREVTVFIPLLRILFEVGMTVEQALRVLSNEGRKIIPELTAELRLVLQRVDVGLELGRELHDEALLLDVDEVTDTFAILEQLLVQGGGALNSLLSLKELIDDRRLTTLEEYISKLSGKMSIVMMVFLFPALLIVLAGPGFIAIIKALGDMG